MCNIFTHFALIQYQPSVWQVPVGRLRKLPAPSRRSLTGSRVLRLAPIGWCLSNTEINKKRTKIYSFITTKKYTFSHTFQSKPLKYKQHTQNSQKRRQSNTGSRRFSSSFLDWRCFSGGFWIVKCALVQMIWVYPDLRCICHYYKRTFQSECCLCEQWNNSEEERILVILIENGSLELSRTFYG